MQRAQDLLRVSQAVLAHRYGVSRNTLHNWLYGKAVPKRESVLQLAEDVFAVDPDLAEELAAHVGETLERLGLVEPPSAAPPAANVTAPQSLSAARVRHLADSVLLSVAEKLDRSPNTLRPLLITAFERADAVGLTVQEVLRGLREGAAAVSAAAGSWRVDEKAGEGDRAVGESRGHGVEAEKQRHG
jgi:transcriptional regulator with XRE-family HTH domain